MEQLRIIRATPHQADHLGYVHAKSWHAAYTGIVPQELLEKFTPEKRSEVFKKIMPTRPEEYYVAYLNESPIGIMIIGTTLDEDTKPNTGEIMALYVLPEYWGRKYGKALMDFGVNRLYKLLCKDITLWVLERNIRARRFYEKYGFIAEGATRAITIGTPLTEVRYILHGVK